MTERATPAASVHLAQEIFRHWEELARAAVRLQRIGLDQRLTLLARAAEAWLEPSSPWLQRAIAAVAAPSRLSPEMLAEALPSMIAPLAGDAIGSLLDRELGDRRMLESFVGGRRAFAPRRLLLILAGNLPGLAAIPSALALAIGSGVLVKCAAGDPVFPQLWAESLGELAPQVAGAIRVARWQGGDRTVEDRLLREADLVVAWGSDEAIASLRARTPGRFLGHGHRLSFALVAREIVENDTSRAEAAAGLARDVSVWDQRGCLSPHTCFVEADRTLAKRFAEDTAAALERLAIRLPPGPTTLTQSAAVRTWREALCWEEPGSTVLGPAGALTWSVAYVPAGDLRPVPPARCIRIADLPDLSGLPHRVVRWRTHLEACGLGASADRFPSLLEAVGEAGAVWVCPLGRMQNPPLEWCAGGRPRVADWVRWAGTARQGLPAGASKGG